MRTFLEQSAAMDSFQYLWNGPNLGLLTIASLLPDDWECEYIDENYKPIDFEADYDIVFISAMTQQAMNAYHISQKFRQRGILTVLGGIHATTMLEETSQYADVVIAGEGEPLVPNFIRDYQNGCTQRIYKEDNPGFFPIENSPLPRYEFLEDYDYPIISLQTTRGCPQKCTFCAASRVFGTKYRRKDNDQIIEELKIIKDKFPGKLVLFADDNLLVLRKQSKDLLRRIAELDLRWIAQTDISIAKDDELLSLMVKAGCQWIVIGFESVSYNSLYNLDPDNWKLKQLPKYKEHIAKIQDVGISIYGTFMVGLDHDHAGIFDNVVDFIKESNLYGVNVTVPTPLPGTELREQLQAENRILDKDWSYYTFWDITIKPLHFTVEELENGLIYIYNKITDEIDVKTRLRSLRQTVKKQYYLNRQ